MFMSRARIPRARFILGLTGVFALGVGFAAEMFDLEGGLKSIPILDQYASQIANALNSWGIAFGVSTLLGVLILTIGSAALDHLWK